MAREAWTDERLDKGFDRVDADLRELRAEIRGLRSDMEKGFERIDGKFDSKFDSLQKTILIVAVTGFSSIMAGLIAVAFAA